VVRAVATSGVGGDRISQRSNDAADLDGAGDRRAAVDATPSGAARSDLVTATYAMSVLRSPIRPSAMPGNNLACTTCHLRACTRLLSLALFGRYGEFPSTAALGADITIEGRLNACMTRIMNGRPFQRCPRDARR